MANVVTARTIIDGDRNVVVLLTAVLDTSNESRAIKVDVSGLTPAPTRVRIDRIQHSISEGLAVLLDWDATTDVTAVVLTGTGCLEAKHFGGITDNSGTGRLGDLYLTTFGWSGTKSYNLLIELVKEAF